MVYRVIGTMSGSSLDGLDIAFVEFQETSGKWTYTLRHCACYAYDDEWIERLTKARTLSALDYQLLHTEYGHYSGELINRFIAQYNLQYQVQLIASHGHTVFHIPEKKTTAQLGCGAAIAAATGINVVSELRAMDMALGGQGAPIVPIGEKLLLGDYHYFLNLGGIANISLNMPSSYVAFDVCPANRVLNMLAKNSGKEFDERGAMARNGKVHEGLLNILGDLEYYQMPYPKSLSNDFGTEVIYPLLSSSSLNNDDRLRTYVEHICRQIAGAISGLQKTFSSAMNGEQKMLVTGGGAKNIFLMERLRETALEKGVHIETGSDDLVDYKEAIIMGLIGLLRWREENNTLASVTGASRNSIGGAVWIGLEA